MTLFFVAANNNVFFLEELACDGVSQKGGHRKPGDRPAPRVGRSAFCAVCRFIRSHAPKGNDDVAGESQFESP